MKRKQGKGSLVFSSVLFFSNYVQAITQGQDHFLNISSLRNKLVEFFYCPCIFSFGLRFQYLSVKKYIVCKNKPVFPQFRENEVKIFDITRLICINKHKV